MLRLRQPRAGHCGKGGRAGASGGEAAALKAWKAAIQDVLQPSELSVLREMVVAFWSV